MRNVNKIGGKSANIFVRNERICGEGGGGGKYEWKCKIILGKYEAKIKKYKAKKNK